MKKILLALIAMVACTTINAKVVKITSRDKTTKVYTSSQLSAIDFNDNGTTTIKGFDGQVLAELSSEVEDVEISDTEAITEIKPIIMEFKPELLDAIKDPAKDLKYLETVDPLDSRAAHQINFVYPSIGPDGPVTLSGCIFVPDEIWNAEKNSEGIVLFNHFSTSSPEFLPSNGMAFLESWFLANPLKPDFIIVESDLYGWGVTERFPQAYQQGDLNGQASVDALLAARRILRNLSVNTGILNFNVGYSSGGFDALATQRVRDMNYPYEIVFDKTFAGGAAADLERAYTDMVKRDSTGFTASIPLLLVATNETQKLGLNYEDVFTEELYSRLDELVFSKKYTVFAMSRAIGRNKKIHEMLKAPYLDLESPESKFMQDVYERISLTNGWVPNPAQRIFIYHSRTDDIVSVQSCRNLLKLFKENGYEPSIIPGATNLQTNFVMPIGHMQGVLPWFIQTLAAIKAWPYMYYDGELNDTYKFLVDQTKNDPIALLRYFDSIGFDCRGVIKQLLDLNPNYLFGEVDEASLAADVMTVCQLLGISYEDFNEMMEDSGVDFEAFLIELTRYINENPGQDIFKGDIRTLRSSNDQVNPVEEYENQLYDWLKANGVETGR